MATVQVGQATETDQALPIHALTVGIVGVAQAKYTVFLAEEGDEAQPIAPKGQGAASKLIGQALEVDTAQPIVPTGAGQAVKVVNTAVESDGAQAITPMGQGQAVLAIGQATETDTAQAITPVASGEVLVGLGVAIEVDEALAITPMGQGTAAVVLAQALEVDTAQAITPRQRPARIIRRKAQAFPTPAGNPAPVATVARDATGMILELTVTDGDGFPIDLVLATEVVVVFRNERARWEVAPSKATAGGLLEAAIPDAGFRRVDAVDYQARMTYADGYRWTRPGRILVIPRL